MGLCNDEEYLCSTYPSRKVPASRTDQEFLQSEELRSFHGEERTRPLLRFPQREGHDNRPMHFTKDCIFPLERRDYGVLHSKQLGLLLRIRRL